VGERVIYTSRSRNVDDDEVNRATRYRDLINHSLTPQRRGRALG